MTVPRPPKPEPKPTRGPVLTTYIVVFGLLLAGLLLAAILAFAAAAFQPARAHSFYPWECCSSQDCWPMGRDADAREPDPIGTHAGWLLQDGTIVPYQAARPSPDGRFHICRQGGRASGELIKPSARPLCLWAPVPGS